MNILLVEPAYKVKCPSIGLMRISAYHKSIGDQVEYVRGANMFVSEPDRIYVTSIFTYDYRFVKDAVQFYRMKFPKTKIWLGGLAASLIPDYFKDLGIDYLHKGLYEPAEDCVPDYSLHPQMQKTILLTHRGCVRKCAWCLTHIHDGPFKRKKDIDKYIIKEFDKIECWDNNALANPYFEEVVEILAKYDKEIDFNQSLDIRLLNEKKAKLLKRLKIYPLRFAFDNIEYKEDYIKGIELCKKVGLKQEIRVDVLYNFKDTPQDFYERMHIILNSGACPYPMLYKPMQPDKKWMSPYWSEEELKRWRLFCKSQLGRQGDFFNPRCYIYFKGKRIKMPEIFKKQMFDTPSKISQADFRKELLNKTEQKEFF